eukprot:15474629-Alexandrium_andersonii.AAC.1
MGVDWWVRGCTGGCGGDGGKGELSKAGWSIHMACCSACLSHVRVRATIPPAAGRGRLGRQRAL